MNASDPMHFPGAHLIKDRTIVDADGGSVTWGTSWLVVLPGYGVVADCADEARARRILSAYLDPEATRASVERVWG